jgi:tripartite-type tricarboxylate transporter receptor subunit TctC
MRAVMVMVKVPIVIMGFPGAPFTNVAELVAAARANPGKLSYSSSGIGNPQHLAGELFNRVAGVDTLHVPYRGSGPAVLDIASGQVQFGYNSLASGLSLIREGRIRAIGVTSRERMAQLPDVGAVAEFAPMANYELVNFFGLFAPTAVPEPIMRRLHGIVLSAMREPTLRARFEEQGLQVQGFSLEESQAFMIRESEKLGRIVGEAKITAE